ncbi:MAG: hypothetical protein ABEJ79_00425 [Halolamina sp.]
MVSLNAESLSGLEWLGLLFAAVSGVVHLVSGVGGLPSPLAVSFVLAGLGFAGAIVLILLDWRRRLVYAVGIPFVGAQIGLWAVLNGLPIGAIEVVDKVAQVGLVALCLYFLAGADDGGESIP